MSEIPISLHSGQEVDNSTILSLLKTNNLYSSDSSSKSTEESSHRNNDNLNSSLLLYPHSHANSLKAFIPSSLPNYIHKYPQIMEATQSIHDMVNDWKPDTPHGKYELEARFGQWCGQYFKSGVSKMFIEKILTMFSTFSGWSKITDWEETHDYYYTLKKNVENSVVRTTTFFRFDPLSGKKTITMEHIRKITKKKINLRFMDSYHAAETSGPEIQNLTFGNGKYDLRVCLNYEENLDHTQITEFINPSSVRIKSRKSFYCKSDNFPHDEPVWKFDVTRSWLGNTKSEAEMKQKEGDLTNYEVELECLNPRLLMCAEKYDSFYVMCSMLLKMRDFINYHDFKWEPIPKILINNIDSF